MTDNAVAYDLDNLFDPCFVIIDNMANFHPDCENGANFDAFANFDAIHPTAKVHELLGRILFAFSPLLPPAPMVE